MKTSFEQVRPVTQFSDNLTHWLITDGEKSYFVNRSRAKTPLGSLGQAKNTTIVKSMNMENITIQLSDGTGGNRSKVLVRFRG